MFFCSAPTSWIQLVTKFWCLFAHNWNKTKECRLPHDGTTQTIWVSQGKITKISMRIIMKVVLLKSFQGFANSPAPSSFIKDSAGSSIPARLWSWFGCHFSGLYNSWITYESFSTNGKLTWSIKSSILDWSVGRMSAEMNKWVSSKFWMIKRQPRAKVSSRWRRNCFIAWSLKNKQKSQSHGCCKSET